LVQLKGSAVDIIVWRTTTARLVPCLLDGGIVPGRCSSPTGAPASCCRRPMQLSSPVQENARGTMPTNDHTVPRMYLRRFSRQKKKASKNWFVSARSLDSLDRVFQPNICNVAAVTDFYGAPAERLLGRIEADAAPVFGAVLDDPRYALPARWPLSADERLRLAWWIAAQIVRTTRQRRRLAYLTTAESDGQSLEIPHLIKSLAGRDTHLRFMADQLAALAWIVHNRSWGLGFSDACLWTSDVPVVMLNGHDDEDQLVSAAYWDVVLPLDPHRFLILPGLRAREEDPAKQVDHRTKFHPGLCIFLNGVIFDAADTHLYHHPDHDPLPYLDRPRVRLPTPWSEDQLMEDQQQGGPSYIIEYATLSPKLTVERRWLSEHPPRRAAQ